MDHVTERSKQILTLIDGLRKKKAEVQDAIYSADGLKKLETVARQYDGEYKLIWSDDLRKEIETRPKVTTLNTGIGPLDTMLGGFRPQQLVTLSAHSKHGKTAFSLFLIEQLAEANPLLIPLEQSNEELIEQRIQNNYSVPRFLSPRMLAARASLDWVEQRIVEAIAKYNSKVVVIDHLGYLDDMTGNYQVAKENHAYRIQLLMQGIKTLAKTWNVTIILLVHISQKDEGVPPSLQDLKGSSSILQESDTVIMLWRKNELRNKVRLYEDKTMVSVLANRRNGKNGSFGMSFDRSCGRYIEDQSWVQDMLQQAENVKDFDESFDRL